MLLSSLALWLACNWTFIWRSLLYPVTIRPCQETISDISEYEAQVWSEKNSKLVNHESEPNTWREELCSNDFAQSRNLINYIKTRQWLLQQVKKHKSQNVLLQSKEGEMGNIASDGWRSGLNWCCSTYDINHISRRWVPTFCKVFIRNYV